MNILKIQMYVKIEHTHTHTQNEGIYGGQLYTPNSKKDALGIGNWALGSYCLGIRKQWMLCLSDRQTIASQSPTANAQSNLF